LRHRIRVLPLNLRKRELPPLDEGEYHALDVSILNLLTLKAMIVFIAGEYDDAISRVDDLIGTVGFDATCHAVRVRA
jgi:hypothetical protein